MALAPEEPGAFLRVITVGVHRYSREPETRVASARLILGGALALLRAETSPAQAANIVLALLEAHAANDREAQMRAAMGQRSE